MTVTEIGLLRLKPPTAIDNPELQAGIAEAKRLMQDFTGKNFYYLQQVEDPSFIYVLGEWESIAQHNTAFHSTKEFREGVPKMARFLEFQWQSHFDVPLADIQLNAPVLSLGRYMIKEGKREDFTKCVAENRKHLDAFVTEGKAAGGWRLDDGRKREEFVLLAPWKQVPQHHEFGKTEGFKEFSKIEDFIEEADIKHVRIMKEL